MVRLRRTMKNIGVVPVLLALILAVGLALSLLGPAAAQQKLCPVPVDVMLVLDSSDSLSTSDLSKLKTAAIAFVDVLMPDESSLARIGVVDFDTNVVATLGLTGFANKSSIIAAINAVGHVGGTEYTNTTAGINAAQGKFEGNGVPRVMIIITDGLPNRPSRTPVQDAIAAAAAAKADGTEIFVVGIRSTGSQGGIDQATLNALASDPDSTHSFLIEGYSGLEAILADLISELCPNHPPVVTDIPNQTIAEGGTFATINLDGYVSDVDNTDAEMAWTASGNTSLTVDINASRVATISIPNADWNGEETITFRATDPGLLYDEDTATFNVTAVNDAPVANDDAYSVDEDTLLDVAVPGVLANDSDADLDPLTAILVSDVSNGTLSLASNGSFTYTPDADWNGVDSFTYKANDGIADSNIATVNITVNAVNDAPVAVDDAYSVDEDNTLTVGVPGVLLNDSDPEGDTLTAVWVSGPGNGTLTLYSNGSFTYTPDADWNGVDSFTYKANDGELNSTVATVTITVNPVNEQPRGGGGGGGGSVLQLDVDLWGEVSSWYMNYNGVLLEDVNTTSTDGSVTVHIPSGTKVLDPDGEPLDEIVVTPMNPSPTPPEGCHVIAAFDFEPTGSTFDPGIEITIPYDPDALPEGVDEANLVIAFFDDETMEWVFVTGVVDTDANTVTFSIDHFTVFAIIGREEAAFTFSDLSISPSTVEPGESVTITAQVTNSGGIEGNCTVALLIDGAIEETEEVTLGPGVSDIITFTLVRDIPGTYAVEIGGLTGELAVIGPFPWWLVGGIAGGVLGLLAVAVITAYFVVFRRRRTTAQ